MYLDVRLTIQTTENFPFIPIDSKLPCSRRSVGVFFERRAPGERVEEAGDCRGVLRSASQRRIPEIDLGKFSRLGFCGW